MEKFSYNSYPDSAESSPRSRDVDFDNPPPWEDQQQQQQQTQHSYKVKFMCSYGGKIQPRPHDNQLTYVNGDTKILSVDRGIRFPALASKLSAVVGVGGGGGDGGEISFKYQLPGEDLDALISVTNEDDLEHMMHEYDRLLRMSSKPARMRLFLFPSSPVSVSVSGGGFGSEGSTKSDRETLSAITNRPESEKSVTAPASNADFLFGSEKVVVAPPSPPPAEVTVAQQIQDPQMFVNQQVMITPEQEIQRQIHEFQRIQIRDQEQHQQIQQLQQQEAAMYRRNSQDGRYFTPTYPQNPPPQQPQPTTTSQQPPPVGYWQGNNNNNVPGNNIYTTTEQQQQVYMIPAQSQAPGTLYHSVMRPPPPTQGSQGYYPPVQRIQQHHPDPYMEQQNQQGGYNVVQPPQPTYSGGPQVMSSGPMGLHETPPYSQMGNPVYYTVAGDGTMVPPHQPQYQGMGQPVSSMTGPDGKVVVNTGPKVSQSADSV